MQVKERQIEIPVISAIEERKVFVGNEPMIFHCHHFNSYLQQSILDAEFIDSKPNLVGAAAEVAYSQMSDIFSSHEVSDIADRKAKAQEIYQWAGFGTVNLDGLTDEGGVLNTENSHYVMGWQVRSDRPALDPICYFTAGWLAGTLAAIYDKPNGSFQVHETRCAAQSEHSACSFELKPGTANYNVFQSVGQGVLSKHAIREIPKNNVNYEGIFQAVSGMPLVGNDRGLIPAFGVYLTRHYANYYNRVSFEFERTINEQFGPMGLEIGASLLTEAGRVCAFNTFGGIMKSSEWDALVRPSLKSKEDWVHGMVAVVNALAWGRWQVTSVSDREAEFVVHDDYESSGYLAMYGKSPHSNAYLVQGAAIGIMNLVYLADIHEKPTLDAAFYQKIFKQDHVYEAEPLTCKSKGDEVTSFRVFY